MINRLALAATLALASGCAAAAAPFWQKDWRFGAVTGSSRAVSTLRSTGADRLRLTPDRVDDPIGEGCAGQVSYADLKHRSRAELAPHIGRLWKLPPTIDRPGSVSGWVRCGGENVAAVAFISPTEGYRFFEEGLVIGLR